MKRILQIVGGSIALLLLVVATCTFVVSERQQAVVLQLGEIKREVSDPGLHFKLPLIQSVRYFEDRILPLETPDLEVLAVDQRRIVIDAFARWRIDDPLRFLQTVGDERGALNRIDTALNASVREVLGGEPFNAVLSGERSALMQRISQDTAESVADLGVEIVDVRIRRADLPEQNLEATYARMETERQQEAADFRARGREAAQIRRAEADRAAVELVSTAQRQSQIIRGEADAETAKIFGEEFGQDPEFFAFYRSLLAYETALGGENSSIILSPDSDFFEYLKSRDGASRQ